MNNKNLLITGIAVVVVAAVAFFAGMQYQKSQRGQFGNFATGQGTFQNRFAQGGQNGARRVNQNGGAVLGEIISSDDKSITVKLSDGSSKIVLVTSSSNINKAAKGTVADLTKGNKVAVFGTVNSDGSVTAQNIQLNPTMRMQAEVPSGTPAGQ